MSFSLSDTSKVALLTATNKHFLPGTAMLFASFQKHNPWFRGIKVIITDQPEVMHHPILSTCSNLRVHQVSKVLHEKLDKLTEALPKLAGKRSRFYSLEAFCLSGYDKLIYMDSDMLCAGNIRELFNMPGNLLCCPDVSHYQNKVRNKTTFEKMDVPLDENKDDYITSSFNAGLIIINNTLINKATYQGLLEYINPDRFAGVLSGHTDQYILNHYFDGQAQLLSPKYNFLWHVRQTIQKKEGINPEDALLIHYVGRPKPWQFDKILKRKLRNGGSFKSLKPWYQAYKAHCEAINEQNGGLKNQMRSVKAKLLNRLITGY